MGKTVQYQNVNFSLIFTLYLRAKFSYMEEGL